jgi:hypothetical protein
MVTSKRAKVEGPKPITVTIVLSDGLWTDLRKQALEEKRSASDIIRGLVADYLKKVKARKGGG